MDPLLPTLPTAHTSSAALPHRPFTSVPMERPADHVLPSKWASVPNPPTQTSFGPLPHTAARSGNPPSNQIDHVLAEASPIPPSSPPSLPEEFSSPAPSVREPPSP